MFAREPLDMDLSSGMIVAGENAGKTIEALKAEREYIVRHNKVLDARQSRGEYED